MGGFKQAATRPGMWANGPNQTSLGQRPRKRVPLFFPSANGVAHLSGRLGRENGMGHSEDGTGLQPS